MKLFKPQVQLVKVTDAISPDEYHLHVVTFTDMSNYREDGYWVGTVDQSGVLVVKVKAILDGSIMDFPYLTPIVHTINLGALAFPGGEGFIEVIFEDSMRGPNTGKKNIVRTVDADEDSRPIG